MSSQKNHLSWKASVWIGLISIVVIVIAFSFDLHIFGRHDPFNRRAYFFGATMASVAALTIGFAIRGIEVRANRAGSVIGMILGTLVLLASAAFLLGTIMPGD